MNQSLSRPGKPDVSAFPVMHLDFVALSEAATIEGIESLVSAAAELASGPDVVGAGVIEAADESDFDLAFFFVLRDFTALEPFGTDPRYSQFLQRYVAPVLRQLAGADVRLEGWQDKIAAHAACLAVAAEEETYDWEITEALEGWAHALDPGAVVGLAVGKRQRYRGVALAFSEGPLNPVHDFEDRFTVSRISGAARALP